MQHTQSSTNFIAHRNKYRSLCIIIFKKDQIFLTSRKKYSNKNSVTVTSFLPIFMPMVGVTVLNCIMCGIFKSFSLVARCTFQQTHTEENQSLSNIRRIQYRTGTCDAVCVLHLISGCSAVPFISCTLLFQHPFAPVSVARFLGLSFRSPSYLLPLGHS